MSDTEQPLNICWLNEGATNKKAKVENYTARLKEEYGLERGLII